jgi:hypothetical protein
MLQIRSSKVYVPYSALQRDVCARGLLVQHTYHGTVGSGMYALVTTTTSSLVIQPNHFSLDNTGPFASS